MHNTHTHLFGHLLLAAAVSIATIALAEHASAQLPRYRVTDLKNIGTQFTDTVGTIGINNKGQVVYTATVGTNVVRAWVWLPTTDYGFTTAGLHDLDTSENSSIARDINEDGKIAGVSGGLSGSSSKATMWTLASGSATPTLFSTGNSEAHALNNDDPPILVGQYFVSGTCQFSANFDVGFSWPVGSSVDRLDPVGTYEGQDSIAYDILRNGTPVIVGLSEPCEKIAECPGEFEGAWCDDSAAGDNVDVGSFKDSFINRNSYPRGVNDDARIVGWVIYQSTSAIQCFDTADFWASPTDTDPLDLSAFLKDEEDQSRAYAINSLQYPQVVGVNWTNSHGWLWEMDSSSDWSSVDLDHVDLIGGCTTPWDVFEAHDINDNGWIVAKGAGGFGGGETHVLLLTPVEDCPIDINDSGCINIDDLVLVIAHWGNCPTGVICRWDINFTCTVDIDDLALIVSNWCKDCNGSNCCSSSFIGGGDPLAEIIAAVLASDLSDSEKTEIITYLLSH